MSSKRPSPDGDSNQSREAASESPPPAAKRQRLVDFEPVRLKFIDTVAELDRQAMVVQNYKLSERLVHKERMLNEQRARVQQLERRQTQDDAMLCIINRCWNRLDEEVRLLLQRFDAEAAVESETERESEATKNFLALLSHLDQNEIEPHLGQRVEFSRRAVAKLVQAVDRIGQRNERITALLHELKCKTEADQAPSAAASASVSRDDSVDRKPTIKTETDNNSTGKASGGNGLKAKFDLLNDEIANLNRDLQSENTRLQSLVTKLQSTNHETVMKHSKCEDQLATLRTRYDEMDNKLEDSKYQLEKSMMREDKIEFRLADVGRQLQSCQMQMATEQKQEGSSLVVGNANNVDSLAKVSKTKLDELQSNLDDQTELANNRLTELQELTDNHKKAVEEVELLRMQLSHIPAEVITSSTEYKCLQSQFSVLYQESVKIRQRLEDVYQQLQTMKTAHLKQIEQMEGDELLAQKQLRSDMLNLEEQLSQVRKEYEMLRLEFEQTLAANEQSGPLNKEMRQMLASYKAHNQQLKLEVDRFKRKWKEAVSGMAKSNKELEQERKIKELSIIVPLPPAEIQRDEDSIQSPTSEGEGLKVSPGMSDAEEGEVDDETSTDKDVSTAKIRRLKKKVSELKGQLRVAADMNADEKTRLQVVASERRMKLENDKLRTEMRRIGAQDKRERLKLATDDAVKRIRYLEEQIEKVKKESANAKQEEDGLLNEMEVTGQAFEEMQEQNTKLLQQLKEKDDANFKLMSDRIRSNQQHKKLKEEKELMEEQVGTLKNQVAAQNLVVRKLEEKERVLHQSISLLENEMKMRQQALELNKRKATEFAQSTADLKLQLEKTTSQLLEAQHAVTTKTSSLQEEVFKISRLQEEISVLRKRLERVKKLEKAEKVDEVLMEEIKELKELLTCPSCKVNRKDAILTKCYHVFCMDCLKTRYENRRRKCPKCSAAFGANDYRRIYIA